MISDETGRLSGSSKPVIYGIGNRVEKLGMDLSEVVKMSSLTAARKYALTDRGSIKDGHYADFVVIDDDYNALCTFVEGRKVWDSATMTRPFNPDFLKEVEEKYL